MPRHGEGGRLPLVKAYPYATGLICHSARPSRTGSERLSIQIQIEEGQRELQRLGFRASRAFVCPVFSREHSFASLDEGRIVGALIVFEALLDNREVERGLELLHLIRVVLQRYQASALM